MECPRPSDKGWPDLLSKRGGIDVGNGVNLYDTDEFSWLSRDANATADAVQPMADSISTPPSPPSGTMTRARAKALHD